MMRRASFLTVCVNAHTTSLSSSQRAVTTTTTTTNNNINNNHMNSSSHFYSALRKPLGHSLSQQQQQQHQMALVQAQRFIRRVSASRDAAAGAAETEDKESDLSCRLASVTKLEVYDKDQPYGPSGVPREHKIKKAPNGPVEMSSVMPKYMFQLPITDSCSADELSRQFNLFAKTIDGCTQEEFLQGVQQSYYVLGQMTEQLTVLDKHADVEVAPRKSGSNKKATTANNNNNSSSANASGSKTTAMSTGKSGESTFANGTTTALNHASSTFVAHGKGSEAGTTAATSGSSTSEKQQKATAPKDVPPPELYSGKTTPDALHVAMASRKFLNTLQSVYDLPRDESEWRPQSQNIVRFWEHVKYSAEVGTTSGAVAAQAVDTTPAATKRKVPAEEEAKHKATATMTAAEVDLRQQRAEQRRLVKERTQQASHDMEASSVKRAVGAVTSLLPLSGALAETYFKAYALQRREQLSMYLIAGPNDYILNPHIGMFITFPQKTSEAKEAATTPDEVPLKEPVKGIRTRKQQSDHVMRRIDKLLGKNVDIDLEDEDGFDGSEDDRVQVLFADDTPCEFNLSLTLDSSTDAKSATKESEDHVRSNATEEAEKVEKDTAAIAEEEKEAEDGHSKPILEIKMGDTTLSPIPASARACAAVWVDVVVPPARTNRNYDFFYKRVQDTESEYERVAISRIIAQHAPMWLFASLDFLVRMFTGRQSEFTFSRRHARMIGVPERIAECPPVQRKLILMYMDAAKRWVLSDMVVVGNAYAGLREDEQNGVVA